MGHEEARARVGDHRRVGQRGLRVERARAERAVDAVPVEAAEHARSPRRGRRASRIDPEIDHGDRVADEVRDEGASPVGRDDDPARLAAHVDRPCDLERLVVDRRDRVAEGRGHQDPVRRGDRDPERIGGDVGRSHLGERPRGVAREDLDAVVIAHGDREPLAVEQRDLLRRAVERRRGDGAGEEIEPVNRAVVGVGGPGHEALAIDHQAASVGGLAGRARRRCALLPGVANHASERQGEQQREQGGGGLSHRPEHDNPALCEVSATSERAEDRARMKDSVRWATMAAAPR